MYTVELDVHLTFSPPMSEHGDGIIMTRTIKLPFPPHVGLSIYSREWDRYPEPHGFEIKKVVWDAQRELFLAEARYPAQDFPIANIPAELYAWMSLGWRMGSYYEHYVTEKERFGVIRYEALFPGWLDSLGPKAVDKLPIRKPSGRPKEFNLFFDSLIRLMVTVSNNPGVAYAMDKTKQYIPHTAFELKHGGSENKEFDRWRQFTLEFESMKPNQKFEWMEMVKQYPSLADALGGATYGELSQKSPTAEEDLGH